MLTVGTDSYITLEEANAYIEAQYRATSELRALWNAITDSDKESYLKQSLQEIDRMQLMGLKYRREQLLQFPRNGWEVPQIIKDAQAENALGILHYELMDRKRKQMNAVNGLGFIKSVKPQEVMQAEQPVTNPRKLLTSEKATKLIKGWLR